MGCVLIVQFFFLSMTFLITLVCYMSHAFAASDRLGRSDPQSGHLSVLLRSGQALSSVSSQILDRLEHIQISKR